MSIDWTALYTVAGAAIGGLATWIKTRKPNEAKVAAAVAAARAEESAARADSVNSEATSAAVSLLRAELERIGSRVIALEKREGLMIRHIYRLEGLMHAAGLTPPPFELDVAAAAFPSAEAVS